MRERLRWMALHGFVRGMANLGMRRGDPQARLIADPVVRADPTTFADEMRKQGPVIRGRVVLLSFDHGVAFDLLRSDDFRVSQLGANLPAPLRWIADRTNPGLLHPIEPPSLLSIEPPDHTRMRKLVSSVFTTRAVATLRELVERTAHELLDGLEADSRGVVDVVERYCARLPVAVIGDILGVPDHDRPNILRYGELGAPSLDIGLSWRQYQQVNEGIIGFETWLNRHLRTLRREPGDDLLSQIITASESGATGEPLTDRELKALAGLVLAAGFETTVNLLGNGIRMLLDHPEHLETLAARPEVWPNAVEEILRLDSPVQMTARAAVRDVEVAGTAVSGGELVVLHLAGANRDPKVFDDPHRFDIERDNAGRHLSFSGGRHFCLGAALARAEGEVGLRAFFERFPDARLAGDAVRRDTRVLRGWSTLPIALGKARAAVGS
ncbi:cytochrome P450 [Mycolicibacterium goodii]|uniref:Cytochrome P450 n=1 Tax=Mycolicibacterium goodii TaxID=134601 RepID=A0ABS6HZ65_MYCGD|nr:cytochrome P450 [Mycolicibacterium goodii]MBU8808037.1 cytochrome P450 [Mycolicibacterium goodii]MBU8826790.1 cytochrome P450 [Mycolicibacterium goodii]MBU8840392.1 cytochrome P450 [Mycolicibacterium goodii]OKH63041.1 cytochrome P450 [Mycobacterium sp. SWH-M5]